MKDAIGPMESEARPRPDATDTAHRWRLCVWRCDDVMWRCDAASPRSCTTPTTHTPCPASRSASRPRPHTTGKPRLAPPPPRGHTHSTPPPFPASAHPPYTAPVPRSPAREDRRSHRVANIAPTPTLRFASSRSPQAACHAGGRRRSRPGSTASIRGTHSLARPLGLPKTARPPVGLAGVGVPGDPIGDETGSVQLHRPSTEPPRHRSAAYGGNRTAFRSPKAATRLGR